MKKQKGVSTTLSILLIVLLVTILGAAIVYKYYLVSEEGTIKIETKDTKWKDYELEEISQDFESSDFYDRHLIGIQDNGQRDIILLSIKEALGGSKDDITWYPKRVSFPPYSSKIFFVKYLSETGHSIGLIMFDVKNLTFEELTEVGEIYQNYYNYESIVSADGFKIASLGYDKLYLLDLLNDEAKLLTEAKQEEGFDLIFWPAKETPDFIWLDNNTIQYPVYSIEGIWDPPIEIRQISTEGVEKIVDGKTINWGTYRNEKYGFELKYPKDWKTTINESGMYLLTVLFQKVDTTQEKFILPGDYLEDATYDISLTIKNNPQNYSIKDCLLEDTPLESREKTWEEEYKEIIIGDNLRGIKYTIFAAPASGSCTIVAISHDNKIYKFSYCAIAHSETHTKFIKVFNQMLSTFKFIEEPQSEITDWQTYRNEKYKFEFKYPEEWELSEIFTSSDIFPSYIEPEQDFLPINVVIRKRSVGLYNEEDGPGICLEGEIACGLGITTTFKISKKYNQDFEKELASRGQSPIYKIKIGGENAVEHRLDVAPGSLILRWLLRDGKGFAFTSSASCQDDCEFDQILSTFRFIE
jgi:hypothetical protein